MDLSELMRLKFISRVLSLLPFYVSVDVDVQVKLSSRLYETLFLGCVQSLRKSTICASHAAVVSSYRNSPGPARPRYSSLLQLLPGQRADVD